MKNTRAFLDRRLSTAYHTLVAARIAFALMLFLAFTAADVVDGTAEVAAQGPYRLDPFPASLDQSRGVHPRLLVTTKQVAEIRQNLDTTLAPMWVELRRQADVAVRKGPPLYRLDDGSGDEQLWQREVGNTMPKLALAYLVTNDRRYLEAARTWALASCNYKTWGLGRLDGMGLATAHQLFGLAIIYDWCYHDLDAADLKTIRNTLVRRANFMFKSAAVDGTARWRHKYLQNHLWVDACGVSAAGLALFDEVDDASSWIAWAVGKFRKTMASLGTDGASHEGPAYWQYGTEHMMKFMCLADQLLDEDMWDHPWWRNTAAYIQYASLPRGAWRQDNCLVNLADGRRYNKYGPDYLLRGLARQYRDGHAQWLAQQLDTADVVRPTSSWLNLIWHDANVAEVPPQDLPTQRHFDDLDIVSARSDWSGNESLVVFKCGPCIGHHAIELFNDDPGAGHVHPDANHFVLFGAGEWLLRDDGSSSKWTGQHNTLLIEGRGQLGEGKKWFEPTVALRSKARPRVLFAKSSPELDQIAGDATEAYPRNLGLKRFVRYLLFVKPDVLIVVDDIEVEKAARMELRFHPEQQHAARQEAAFLLQGEKSVLRIEPLTLQGVKADAAVLQEGVATRKPGIPMYTVRLSAERSRWRNAVALSWGVANTDPHRITFSGNDDLWTFLLPRRRVTFDWTQRLAQIESPGQP